MTSVTSVSMRRPFLGPHAISHCWVMELESVPGPHVMAGPHVMGGGAGGGEGGGGGGEGGGGDGGGGGEGGGGGGEGGGGEGGGGEDGGGEGGSPWMMNNGRRLLKVIINPGAR